jgi:hypothetical protein
MIAYNTVTSILTGYKLAILNEEELSTIVMVYCHEAQE